VLDDFSRELRQRYPFPWPIKRYVLPLVVTEIREVFMRELRSRDVIEAATMADSLMSGIEKASFKLSNEAEERECIRLAIVGFGELRGGAVVYRHVNANGTPLAEINNFGKRIWDAMSRYYNDTNGLPFEEFIEGLRGGQTVGAFALPTSGTPASADPGRSGG